MDAHKRLRKLMAERGWTEYRLSKESGLSESTLSNVFRRNTMPSLNTLEYICDGFGITLSQFFAEDDLAELTPELKMLFNNWVNLTAHQKRPLYMLYMRLTTQKRDKTAPLDDASKGSCRA